MDVPVREVTCKSALYFHNSKWLPYRYDINVYRGCAHRCIYCYAPYSHDYLGGGDFFGEIYAKTNIADVLRRELPGFSREPVNLGGVCDSYQPAEKQYRLMPGVLELLAKFGVPVTLCTKSDLVLRDLPLLKKVNDAGGLMCAFTITTMDETTARLIEPNAPLPAARMRAVKELKKQGIRCGVHLMPVLPVLTSGEDSVEAVFSAAKDAGADYVLTGALNLKNKRFFDGVRQAFPGEYARLRAVFADRDAYRAYKADQKTMIERLRTTYRMPAYASLPVKRTPEQLSFFQP